MIDSAHGLLHSCAKVVKTTDQRVEIFRIKMTSESR